MKSVILIIFIIVIYFPFFSQENLLKSSFFVDTVFSKSLNENRLLAVYLPKGFNRDSIYPVIYTTDGQIINEGYKNSMDSLIELKLIPQIVLIGVHSNETPVKGQGEIRNFEYMESRSSDKDSLYGKRFNNHMLFFTEEVPLYGETKYSLSKLKKDRTFFGCSNGADFGVSLSMHKPSFCQNFVYCSIFNGTELKYKWANNDGLNFYIYYGDKEESFVIDNSKRLGKYFKKNKINYFLKSYKGGHERLKWKEVFLQSLPKIYSTIK